MRDRHRGREGPTEGQVTNDKSVSGTTFTPRQLEGRVLMEDNGVTHRSKERRVLEKGRETVGYWFESRRVFGRDSSRDLSLVRERGL